jgi:imidazolonepropionase-like amidohydrolase
VIRFLIALCLVVLCGCTEPPTPDTKVIIGATLVRPSQPPMPNAVIVVKDDKIAAIGSQQMTPIPPASTKMEAYGKYVIPADGVGEMLPGTTADLVILSEDPVTNPNAKVERRMRGGRWIE